MGMSLQVRESLTELLFSDKYDTDDTELLVERRFEKPDLTKVNPEIENPLFKKITRLMEVQFDNSELRDFFFSFSEGKGVVLVMPFKDTQYFLALDLHRDRLGDTDAATLAVFCDARKYVKLKELFELLAHNCKLITDQDVTETPLVKAVLESDGKSIFYRGNRIPIATPKQIAMVCPGVYLEMLLKKQLTELP